MKQPEVATEQVWQLLSDRLRSFFLQRVSDEATAEDLLQESFLRIHGKLGSIENEERIVSWVFQIARNLTVDHYRARDHVPGELPGDLTGPVEIRGNVNHVVTGWLPAMIQRLPETYREAVELYELQGVSQQEIATRLGISLSGAKSRIQRGRRKLEQMLADCCSFERDRRGNILDWRKRTGC